MNQPTVGDLVTAARNSGSVQVGDFVVTYVGSFIPERTVGNEHLLMCSGMIGKNHFSRCWHQKWVSTTQTQYFCWQHRNQEPSNASR